MKKSIALFLLFAIFIAAGVALLSYGSIPQDPDYHRFADNRTIFGIPNFNDVISNAAFIIVGVLGLRFLRQPSNQKIPYKLPGEKLVWAIFFLGLVLIGLGSGYYHLSPNNNTLVYDRLPMTIAFMALFAFVIMDRINPKLGLLLCPILIALGIASVFYWHYTESIGHGDLRWYVLVQFAPMILIPIMMFLLPSHYTKTEYIFFALVWYALAKVAEYFDSGLFKLTHNTLSGRANA